MGFEENQFINCHLVRSPFDSKQYNRHNSGHSDDAVHFTVLGMLCGFHKSANPCVEVWQWRQWRRYSLARGFGAWFSWKIYSDASCEHQQVPE
jgi:hypothetical protein